jgi:hypothetical protein
MLCKETENEGDFGAENKKSMAEEGPRLKLVQRTELLEKRMTEQSVQGPQGSSCWPPSDETQGRVLARISGPQCLGNRKMGQFAL